MRRRRGRTHRLAEGPMAAEPAAPDLSTRLAAAVSASYRIDGELRAGGMSRVFLATELRFQRRVVIKVLAPELSAGLQLERFEREVRLAAGLQDPHIVPVLSAGELDGLPYYTMPYVDGASLRARLEERRTLSATIPPTTRSRSCSTSRVRSPTRTRAASSIATSSPRTCCSPATRPS